MRKPTVLRKIALTECVFGEILHSPSAISPKEVPRPLSESSQRPAAETKNRPKINIIPDSKRMEPGMKGGK